MFSQLGLMLMLHLLKRFHRITVGITLGVAAVATFYGFHGDSNVSLWIALISSVAAVVIDAKLSGFKFLDILKGDGTDTSGGDYGGDCGGSGDGGGCH